MNDLIENMSLMLRVLFTFFLLYFILPAGIFKHKNDSEYDLGFLDKVFIYLTHSNLITIVVVYILALVQVYETFSLILCYIVIILGLIWYKKHKEGVPLNEIGTHYGGKILDLIETEGSLGKSILHGFKRVLIYPWKTLCYLFKMFIKRPIEGILLLALFGLGAYMRFGHSFIHVYYGASDPYVHLAWIKYIGNNQIFRDGVYPQGYHAILSALNKIFFIDPSVIVRFIGPIIGCMIIVSLFYVLQKQFKKSLIPAILGVAAYVLNTILPQSGLRQISALSEEYAMMFLLPGLYFMSMFFVSKKKYFLVLAAEVLMLTLLIHLYVPIYLALGYVLICLFNLKSFLKIKTFLQVSGLMLGAGILGLLPIGIGFLVGIPLHAPSFDFIRENIGESSPVAFSVSDTIQYMMHDQIFYSVFVAIAALLLFSIIRMFLKNKDYRTQARIAIVFVVLTAILYFQYRGALLGIPVIMNSTRTGKFLTLIGLASFALLVGSLDWLTRNKILQNFLKILVSLALILTIFNYTKFQAPIQAPINDRMEYDEVALATVDIKKERSVFTWTIVSPIEQYSEVMNYGFHYNIWEYVQRKENVDEVVIPTEYVFWFVEIYPINTDVRITPEDATKSFPIITGALDDYYTIDENRRIIMAKAYYLLENELRINPNMSVYRETENMKIYMLRQERYASVD